MATTPTNNPVPSESVQDLLFNSGLLDKFVNDSAETMENRLGQSALTLEGIRQLAVGQLLVAATIFETVELGLSGSVDDGYFYVEGKSKDVALSLYRRIDSTTAELVAEQPSVEATETISTGEGISLDGSDGDVTVEVNPDSNSAALFASALKEHLRIDAKEDQVIANRFAASEFKTAKAAGNSADFDGTETFELSATKSTIIADSTGRRVMQVNPSDATIDCDFLINQNQEPRPIFVAVDKGPEMLTSATDRAPYAEDLRPYQGTPSIAKTGDRIWITWRADLVVGENPNNFIVTAYSDDDGATFVEDAIVTYPDDEIYQIVDPMYWVNPEGVLYLWFGIYGKGQGQDGVCSFWAMTCKNPEAEFRSWSKAFRMSYFGDPRHVTKINEEYWLPMDTWRSNALYPPAYPSKTGPRLCRLDWQNRIVRPISRLPPNYNGAYSGFFETEIVQLSTGRIMATNRIPSGLVRCHSDDDGQTWSAFEPYEPVLGTVSSSRIWLGTTPTGRVLICYNNDSARRTLVVALSEDDGESFPYRVELDAQLNAQRTYPVVAFDGDKIYVTYDSERERSALIRLARLNESDLVAGVAAPVYTTVSQPEGLA